MSQRPSIWFDTRIYLAVSAALLLVIAFYNKLAAVMGIILLYSLYLYGRERHLDRQRELSAYLDAMTQNLGQASLYVLQNLPMAIAIIEQSGRIEWRNGVLADWAGKDVEVGDPIKSAWPQIDHEKLLG